MMNAYLFWFAVTWWGLGCMTVALAWGWETYRANKVAKKIIADIFGTGKDDRGHVIDFHPITHNDAVYVHAHCICGEKSLNYLPDDPSGDSLMEAWAENHIDSLMESSGR